MRKIIFIVILTGISSLIYATDQVPDYLIYKGQKLTLFTSWGHPSPLQTYFSQNNIEYPFQVQSTANYRGHIATWEIIEDKLFLVEIEVNGEIHKPKDYNIKTKNDTSFLSDKVLADWFSGAITCNSKDSYYFYVRYGQIKNVQILTKKDVKKIENISIKDTTDQILMDKYWMVVLNQNYISYYFRLSKEDTISYNGKGGFFIGKSGNSPLLEYFSNDHMKWPYNWENFRKNGAPNCKWIVEDSILYLTDIRLYTGSSFFSIDKDTVSLKSIFKENVLNGKVAGSWISGIYLIKHGKEKEDDLFPAYKEFTATEYSYMRIKNGKIIELYTVPNDFDFKNIPDNIEPGLKKILNELNIQPDK